MKRTFLGVITGLLAAFTILPIFASTPAYAGAGKGMEISPLTAEEVRAPGETFTRNITLRNLTGVSVVATAAVHNFEAEGDSGSPKIDIKDSEADTSFSIRSWIQQIPDIHMKKNETVTVPVTISIPLNAEAGGHYGAVLFTLSADSSDSAEQSQVALGASIGTLFLVRVTGSVVEKLNLDGFYTLNANGDRTPFLDKAPISFVVRLNNVGSVHEKPEGNIVVSDMFGHKVGTVIVNDKGGNILPKSLRRYDQQLNVKNLFGLYSAKLTLVYGNGTTIVKTIHFVVIPWQLILMGVLLLLIIIYLIRNWLQHYRASVIRQVRQRQQQSKQ